MEQTKGKTTAAKWLQEQELLEDIHSASTRSGLVRLAQTLDRRGIALAPPSPPLSFAVVGNLGLQQDEVVLVLGRLLKHLGLISNEALLELPGTPESWSGRVVAPKDLEVTSHEPNCHCRLWHDQRGQVFVLCADARCVTTTGQFDGDDKSRVHTLKLRDYTVDELVALCEREFDVLGWTMRSTNPSLGSSFLQAVKIVSIQQAEIRSKLEELKQKKNAKVLAVKLNGLVVHWIVRCLGKALDHRELTFTKEDLQAAVLRYYYDANSRMAAVDQLLRSNTINFLSLPECAIDDEQAKAIAEALRCNATLQSLELNGNRLTSVGLRHLGECMGPSLAHLDLSHNRGIGDAGADYLTSELLRTKTTLTSLDFSAVGLTDVAQRQLTDIVYDTGHHIFELKLGGEEDGGAVSGIQRGYEFVFLGGRTRSTQRIRLGNDLLRCLHSFPVLVASHLPREIIEAVLEHDWNDADLTIDDTISTDPLVMSLPGLRSLLEEYGIGYHLDSLWLECGSYLPAAAQDSDDLTPSVQPDDRESWAGNLKHLTIKSPQTLTSPLLSEQLPFFRGMSNLESLTLTGNRLTTIDSAWWSELRNLTDLDLSFNAIYELGPQSFMGLTRIQTIDMSDNLIMTVDRGCLAGLTTLTSIDLCRNRIADVTQVIGPHGCALATDEQKEIAQDESVMYCGMSSEPLEVYHHGHLINHSAVKKVDLSWNHFVKQLPQSLTWQLFENLTHLTLSHNRIEELPPMLEVAKFMDLKLTHLDLRHNELTILPGKFFARLQQLESLHLDHNRLAVVSEGAFQALTLLRTLTMSHNQLDFNFVINLPLHLSHTTALQTLDISANPLMCTTDNMFGNSAGSLVTLRMNEAGISHLHPDTFAGLTRLESLGLHNNAISLLYGEHMDSLAGLRRLDVSYNLLRELPWPSLSRLQYLDASWNQLRIESVQVPMLQRLLSGKDVCVRLEGNYLDLQSQFWSRLPLDRLRYKPQLTTPGGGVGDDDLEARSRATGERDFVLVVGSKVGVLRKSQWLAQQQQMQTQQPDLYYSRLRAKGKPKRIALPGFAAQVFESGVLPANAIADVAKLRDLWATGTHKELDTAALYKVAAIMRGEEACCSKLFKNLGDPTQKKVELALLKFVGMDDLRAYLRGLAKSRNSTPDMLHVVLRGSPGVGKTTMAEVITEVYHIFGLIRKNRCVRIVRENIVGKAVGETEKIVSELVKEAEGGVLFVDEAYTLVDDPYGKRAIEGMMDYMLGGKHVFIFAGYNDQMTKFLQVNEGLARRVSHDFHLPDYTPEELAEIVTVLLLKSRSWTLDEGVKEHLIKLIAKHFPLTVRAKENGGISSRIVKSLLGKTKKGAQIKGGPPLARVLSMKEVEKAVLSSAKKS